MTEEERLAEEARKLAVAINASQTAAQILREQEEARRKREGA